MEQRDIKEEIYKCSKCALCRSVCPVFDVFKNEMYLPRGRFNVLNNFFNSGGKLSKKFINALDICLNCGECTKFCPSAINSPDIYTELKSRYYKPFIPFYIKYKFILLYHSFKKHFSKDKLYKIKCTRSKPAASEDKKAGIVYFEGCFNKYINPSDKNAALNLSEKNGYKIIKILSGCCGLPYLSDGNVKGFEKNAAKILKSIPKDAEYIAVSCFSCYEALKNALKDNRIVYIDELVKAQNPSNAEKAVFYKPFSQEKYKGALPLINEKNKYSLMENYFMLKHPELYAKMLVSTFVKCENAENKTIVTSCALSKWGLREGCRRKNISAEIISEAEYLEKD